MVSTPNFSLVRAALTDQPLLERLMQLYCYDWSALADLDVDEQGRFSGVDLEPYWSAEGHHPFVLRVDGRPAGFALVQVRSRLTGTTGVHDMAEFFVLRRYRRQGIGYTAACAVFDLFRGPWEVRQRANNMDATHFWRATIERYTAGAYTEESCDDPAWSGVVQRFTSA
ncbi:MAG: GNAT family N-acetyltransferase [Myxococcales bacterium]|nr:GNAT family N-acetyltransferase [Myxococcales bacterium]